MVLHDGHLSTERNTELLYLVLEAACVRGKGTRRARERERERGIGRGREGERGRERERVRKIETEIH